MKKRFLPLLLLSVCLTACNNSANTDKMRQTAEEQIRASLDYPEELEIINVSEPDSAFGVNYYTEDELTDIAMTMQAVSDKLITSTNGMKAYNPNDYYVNDLASRQLEASAAIGKMIKHKDQRGKFSGWKVKAEYKTRDANGIELRAKRWLFFTKDGSSVYHTFEIPEI